MDNGVIRSLIIGLGLASDNGCWQWQGAKNRTGYGVVNIPGQDTTLAHRLSYVVFKGELADSDLVCHTCDNPQCINPQHLFKGSHRDNSRDAVRKGRLGKLQDDDITVIKERIAAGEKGRDIALAYGVTSALVSMIKHSKRHSVT